MSLVILPLDIVKPLGGLITKVREETQVDTMLDGMTEDLGKIVKSLSGTEEQIKAIRPHLELSITNTLIEIVMDKLVVNLGTPSESNTMSPLLSTLEDICDGRFACGFPGRVAHLESLLGQELFNTVSGFINYYDYYGMLSIWLERVASSEAYSNLFRETMIVVASNLYSFNNEYNLRNVISVSIIGKTLTLFYNAGMEEV